GIARGQVGKIDFALRLAQHARAAYFSAVRVHHGYKVKAHILRHTALEQVLKLAQDKICAHIFAAVDAALDEKLVLRALASDDGEQQLPALGALSNGRELQLLRMLRSEPLQALLQVCIAEAPARGGGIQLRHNVGREYVAALSGIVNEGKGPVEGDESHLSAARDGAELAGFHVRLCTQG